MRSAPTSFSEMLFAVTLVILLAIALGETYAFSMRGFHVSPWIGVMIVHILLSIALFCFRKPVRVALKFSGGPILPWLFGPAVLLGAFLLAFYTQASGPTYEIHGSSEYLYAATMLTLIPVVEEIVFRGGVSPFMSRFVGPGWGVWLAAIVFSLAHSQPTWARLMAFKVGLPLGPFLLGLCCDFLVRRWGRLWPAIIFHGCCNATVYIFSALSPAWLTHFNGLYM